MILTDKRIKRIKPRRFREYALAEIAPGDALTFVHSRDEIAAGARAGHYSAQRACLKNGKPQGPWIVIIWNMSFEIYE